MLGKTNITALKESTLVTEIEDYNWIQMQSGMNGNIKNAIFSNGCLVGISEDNRIIYTTDGEDWNIVALELSTYTLEDLAWDGSKFVFVGSQTKENIVYGLIVTTTDFKAFDIKPEVTYYEGTNTRLWGIYVKNNKCILLGFYCGGGNRYYNTAFSLIGDLKTWEYNTTFSKSNNYGNSGHIFQCKGSIAKNTSGFIIFVKFPNDSNGVRSYNQELYTSEDGITFTSRGYRLKDEEITVFENKDILFYMHFHSEYSYALVKIINNTETANLCIDQNFMFKDGVYFNGCQLFINSHDMLIVKKNESISEKTVNDLKEIAPEATMNCITKAFGKLYIFGNQGLILKSTTETNNEEVIAVQTLSAKKALAEAKKYVDDKLKDAVLHYSLNIKRCKNLDNALDCNFAVKEGVYGIASWQGVQNKPSDYPSEGWGHAILLVYRSAEPKDHIFQLFLGATPDGWVRHGMIREVLEDGTLVQPNDLKDTDFDSKKYCLESLTFSGWEKIGPIKNM